MPYTTYCNRISACIFLALLALATGLDAKPVSRIPFQFPLTGSRWVAPGAQIIIRPGAPITPALAASTHLVVVTGSRSGLHAGSLVIADDQRTLIFKPTIPFMPNEKVTVAIGRGLRDAAGSAVAPWRFSFSTSLTATPPAVDRNAIDELAPLARKATPARDAALATAISGTASGTANPIPESGRYAPAGFPKVTITTYDNPTPGLIYLGNFTFDITLPNTPFLASIDNSGVPTFTKQVTSAAHDFKWQPNGTMTYVDVSAGKFFALDSNYAVVDSFQMVGGYAVDIHDLEILPNGHALLIGTDPQYVDMSAITPGGSSLAVVVGLIIQEIDSARNVVFQWRSFDHFNITDATHEDLTAGTIDYVHANAIQLDNDGNILLSSRHMDEITKINHTTGDIIWRLGGKHNQFTFVNDSLGFSHQHAVRRIANGHITLFDNGNFHTPQFSRAVEYNLDENAKTATLVWQYRHVPDIFSFAMGYVQRLDNGNTMIGWGAADTAVTEVRPNGSVAFEMTLPHGVYSYRAYRFPGAPSLSTSLVAPADSASGISTDPVLVWRQVAGASGYRVQIAADSAFATPLADDSSITDVTRRFKGLALDGTYFWRVKPLFPAAEGNWSDSWIFQTAHGAVQLLQPQDVASGVANVPAFIWTAIPEALRYRIQVASDTTFTAVVIDDSAATPQSTFGRLDSATTYYWRVRWANDTAVGDWSARWSFTTVAPYTPQQLQSPRDGTTGLPQATTLAWYAFTDAAGYRLQVATDPNFDAPIVDDPALTATSRWVENLDTNTLYYWRVQPSTSAGAGQWSDIWTFRTGARPDTVPSEVIPIYPPNQSVITADSIRFVWEQATPAVMKYRFELAADFMFAASIIDSLVPDTTIQVAVASLGNMAYWWRVSAVNIAGEGTFGPAWEFLPEVPLGVQNTPGIASRDLWLRAELSDQHGSSIAVHYSVPVAGHAVLTLVDERGTLVATLLDGPAEQGEGMVRFDTGRIPPGRYFFRLSTARGMVVGKVVVGI